MWRLVHVALMLLILSGFAADNEKYKRSLYKHWIDEDKDCQNTRHEVLIEESLIAVTLSEDGCKVITGKWYDYYTDTIIAEARLLDVDHFIPLKEAHISGAFAWDVDKKQAFANDLSDKDALIAVSRRSNRQKGARDIAAWLPDNEAYVCDYIETWVRLKTKWQLEIDEQEQRVIEDTQCIGGNDATITD